jgi:hypothetical protein
LLQHILDLGGWILQAQARIISPHHPPSTMLVWAGLAGAVSLHSLIRCKACQHQVPADLQAIIGAGMMYRTDTSSEKKAGHKRPAKFWEERNAREGSKPPLTAKLTYSDVSH